MKHHLLSARTRAFALAARLCRWVHAVSGTQAELFTRRASAANLAEINARR